MLKQIQHLSTQQTLSARQIQELSILQMTAPELNGYLYELYCENPLCELTPPDKPHEARDLVEWLTSPTYAAPLPYRDEEDEPGGNDVRDRGGDSLQAHLRSQLDMSLGEDDLRVMEGLIDWVTPAGYLPYGDAELAGRMGLEPTLLREALSYLRSLEPAGVGARDLADCLCLQLARAGEDTDLARAVVEHHLEDIAAGRFRKVAAAQGVSTEAVEALFRRLQRLSPRPGAAFAGEDAGYSYVDATVERRGESLHVALHTSHEAALTVNRSYLALADSSAEVGRYCEAKLEQVLWVMEAIANRRRTFERVLGEVVDSQQAFFRGSEDSLRPLRQADVADRMGVHPSTVSRSIRGRTLACPRGLYPVKFFFSSQELNTAAPGGSHAAANRIGQLIGGEDPARPLSDQAIADILRGEGFDLARRTVAKYRDGLGLPTASIRKHRYKA